MLNFIVIFFAKVFGGATKDYAQHKTSGYGDRQRGRNAYIKNNKTTDYGCLLHLLWGLFLILVLKIGGQALWLLLLVVVPWLISNVKYTNQKKAERKSVKAQAKAYYPRFRK